MKLNYKQLTYIIETLSEAKCKAYDAWVDKKRKMMLMNGLKITQQQRLVMI